MAQVRPSDAPTHGHARSDAAPQVDGHNRPASPVTPPPGFWERESSHYPQPLSPMVRSVALPAANAALKHVFDEFSLLVETLELREIGGWVYTRLVPLGGKEQKPPPAWLTPLLIRLVPPLRRRVKGCVAAMRSDKHGRLIERWYADWRPDLTARIARLQATDSLSLSDEAFAAHLHETVALVRDGADAHFLLHGALCLVLGDLAFTCRDLLGWDDQRTFELLAGLSGTSTEPARKLGELAQMARERPRLCALLERADGSTAADIADVDPAFTTAFTEYQRTYGCRALRYEVMDPSLAETPELILRLIRDQIARRYDAAAEEDARARQRVAAAAVARAALTSLPQAEQERFERALTRAERAYPVREENEFYTISAPLALLRHAVLELGRRLAERGLVEQRDDVFFLEMEKARAALRTQQDQRALVQRRREERAWALAHPGPHSFGEDPGPPPSLKPFPPEVRFAMEALIWVLDRIMPAERGLGVSAGGEGLTGIAAAPGRYTGPARVIMGENEFDKLEPGDVLVCPITSPVWSVLFPNVGALVTDTGGILSHPAIIAREYGIPAVVATGNATSRLKDGQIVSVNGDAGVVRLQ